MRILSTFIITALLASTPALAGINDGKQAENFRNMRFESCKMHAPYDIGCMGFDKPADPAYTATPADPRPANRKVPR